MDLDDLKETIKKQNELLNKKDEMILSLISSLNKAYSHLDFNTKEEIEILEEPKRHLIKQENENNKDFNENKTLSNKSNLVLDELIFSNNDVNKHNSCMLCLFPIKDSLHGSKLPKTYTLECGHKFHLLCLYETVQRRECRKVCGECWIDISEDDQNIILSRGKIEKKFIHKESKDIAIKISKYNK